MWTVQEKSRLRGSYGLRRWIFYGPSRNSPSTGLENQNTSYSRRTEENVGIPILLQDVHTKLFPPDQTHLSTDSCNRKGTTSRAQRERKRVLTKSKGRLTPNTPITWTQINQEILNALIDRLIEPPILSYPDFTQPFVLHCDASQEGLGAVLYLRQKGSMTVIAYRLRTLSPPEKNYYMHSGKLEFLALKWAACERFRD